MHGKTLRVVEYNLTFGTTARMVNVFGVFKYKKNNNLYVVYSDDNTKYEIVYYGGSHIKNNTVLSMTTKESDSEIVKEFIYKIINNDDLSDFEFVDLKEIEGIEIISSSKLEVKLEVIRQLEELTIPGKKIEKNDTEINDNNSNQNTNVDINTNANINTNKSINNTLSNQERNKKVAIKLDKKTLIILIIVIVFGGGLILLLNKPTSTISKKIICTKDYIHEDLQVNVIEESTYIFKNGDNLSNIKSIYMYKFEDEDKYQSFINKGTFHKYMSDDTSNKWEQDDNLNTFTITSERNVDGNYKGIRGYEEVIKSYSSSGYSCEEKVEEE